MKESECDTRGEILRRKGVRVMDTKQIPDSVASLISGST